MDVIITEEQLIKFYDFVFIRVVWFQIRSNMETFHATGGLKELSEDDMMNFNIKTIDLISDFYKNQHGIFKKDIPELRKLIIGNVPEILGKVSNKKLFYSEIKSGIISGLDVMKQVKTPKDILLRFFHLPTYVRGEYSNMFLKK
jgi:hypothetical protein